MNRVVLAGRIAIAVAIVALTGVALERWVARPLRCTHAASVAGAVLDRDDRRHDELTRRIAKRVELRLRDCDCVTPPAVVIPFTRGAAMEIGGDPRGAIAEYHRALSIDRRPEIYFRLGIAHLELLDRAAALEHFTRACAFRPALLDDIPYEEVRRETRARIVTRYSEAWLP